MSLERVELALLGVKLHQGEHDSRKRDTRVTKLPVTNDRLSHLSVRKFMDNDSTFSRKKKNVFNSF